MEWTLGCLFGLSILLLIFSLIKTARGSIAEHKRIDMVHVEIMKDINGLKDSIRNIELDMEVAGNEAGSQLSFENRLFMREILDLYKRNYSFESIADMKKTDVNEIRQMLAPFEKAKDERRKAANEN